MTNILSPVLTLPIGIPVSGEMHELRDPGRLSSVAGSYPKLDVGVVDAVVDHAARAQRQWADTDPLERWGLMQAAAGTLDVEALARTLVVEQGKPLPEARLEMSSLAIVLDRYQPYASWLQENNGSRQGDRTIRYRPFGVCAAITPWNWPYRIACALAVPALLAGNSVVLHLAPTAPLAAAAAFGTLARALPEGVLTVLTHPDPSIASALVAHPRVRKVAFTGSTEVGRVVMAAAAENLKNVTLELGGNDPAIVLDDVEPTDEVIDRIAVGAFMTTGQVCMAIKRLYVPNRRLSQFRDALGARLDREIVGHGLEEQTTMGPLHSKVQQERLASLVAQAESAGATITRHGTLAVDPTDGWYMRPTLVSGLPPEAALVAQEQFGPALPVIGYDSEEQAVALANDSEFGLCSSVWSADDDRAYDVARRIEAGTTWINRHGASAQDPHAPFGGIKSSGVGRISGEWGLKAFLEPHSIIG